MVWPFSSSSIQQQEQPRDIKEDAKSVPNTEMLNRVKAMKSIRSRKLIDAVNENCALDSAAFFECQDSWSLWNRLTLCQAFQAKYMDCLTAQRVPPSSLPNWLITIVGVVITVRIWERREFSY